MRESISFTQGIAGEKTEDTPSLPADSFDASSKIDQAVEGPLRISYSKEEIDKYVSEAKVYLEQIRKTGILYEFTRDTSLSFKIGEAGSGFWFDGDSGTINLDPQWFIERGLGNKDIFWATLHEIRHFEDMRGNEESHEQLVMHCIDKARQLGTSLLEKWQAVLDLNDPAQQDFFESLTKELPFDPQKPSRGTLRAYEKPLFKMYFSTLYNCLDDVWVNHGIYDKVGDFEPHKAGGERVRKIYTDVLFPGNDYSGDSRAKQFSFSLLRRAMVPDEDLVLSEEVQEALATEYVRLGRKIPDIQAFVDKYIKPLPGRDTSNKTRYELIQKYLEPLFNDMVRRDLEEFEPKYVPPQEKGAVQPGDTSDQGAETDDLGTSYSPYDEEVASFEENSIDQLPERAGEEMKEFVEKKQAERKAEKEQQEAEDNKTPGQKQSEAQAKARQKRIDKKVNEDLSLTGDQERENKKLELQKNAENYARYVESIKPYVQELASFWASLIGSGKSLHRVDQKRKKEGSLNVQTAIQEWATIKQSSAVEPRVFDKKTLEVKHSVQPEEIRVHLAADMSLSMDEDKRHVLTQVCVLITESIRQFQVMIQNSGYESLLKVDCQIVGYGDQALEISTLNSDIFAQEAVPSKLLADLGGTYNHNALEKIQKSYSEEDLARMKEKKLRSIVLEITDGGSSNSELAKSILENLLAEGSIVRGFQIGTNGEVGEGDKKIFDALYTHNNEKIGEQVLDLKDLAPIFVRLFKKYVGDVEF
jgi:hypothetical protein